MLFALIIMVTGYKIIRSSVAGIMDEVDAQLMNRDGRHAEQEQESKLDRSA